MRRALALAVATTAWVLLIQVASIAMAPPRVIELTPVDISDLNDLDLTLTATNPGLILVPLDGGSFTTTTITITTTSGAGTGPGRDLTRDPVATTTAPVAATTTTIAPVTPATTAAPVTTAPPTTAAPVTTTTVSGPTTTNAPPATTTTAAAASGTFSAAAEADFAGRINGLRSSVGVAGISTNSELNNYARWWAQQMAQSGNFAHSNISSLLDPWQVVGENIGYGPSVNSVFNALVASQGHYNNMVDPRFTAVGVGAFVDSAGRIWTAHVFGG